MSSRCAGPGVACLLAAIAAVALGLLAYPAFDWLLRREITKSLVLRNGTELYAMWRHPTVPIRLQVYVLNLTNVESFRRGGTPHFTEHGPYTYREQLDKVDVRHNANLTVSYRQVRSYVFLPESSVGPESDVFTTINIPVVGLVSWIAYQPAFIQAAASALLTVSREQLSVRLSVNQLLWGYEDPLLRLAKSILPDTFHTDVVGLLAGKNNSDDGVYTIFTGEDDITKLGMIDRYNGQRQLNFWGSSFANQINGSDGSLNPPFVTKKSKLHSFQSIICRSGFAEFDRTVTSPHGIPLYRFVLPRSLFASVAQEPENAGFCTPPGNCMGAGVLNVSTCQMVNNIHIPVVLSFPRFLRADRRYQDGVSGLDPDPSMDTHVDIEPHTGLVMNAERKLQINLFVNMSHHVSLLETIKTVVFPIIWTNESISLDDASAAMLKRHLMTPLLAVHVIHHACLALGGVLALVSAICFVHVYRTRGSAKKSLGGSTGPDTVTERSPLLQANGHANGDAVTVAPPGDHSTQQ